MSRYFSLSPAGMGTPYAEALTSYMLRLADAHGVTRFQLQHYMWADWFGSLGRPHRIESVRLNGYSPDALLAIEVINGSTGRSDLAGCSLAALQKVCAGNYIGSVANVRQWCPICLADDLREGVSPYDRLLWSIATIERCPVHKVALLHQCPRCGVQRNSTKPLTHVANCWKCGANLVGSGPIKKIEKPSLGERQVCRLVEFTSGHPSTIFDAHSVQTFIDRLGSGLIKTRANACIGDVVHKRRHAFRPRFISLVAMAEYFDRDLVDILMDPVQAANTLSFDFPMPEKFRRARRLCGQNNPELAGRLFEILKSSGPYPSFLRICQENGISITTLLNSYPDFVRRLDSLKLHYVVTRKKYLAAKIQRARAYLARNIRHDLTGSGRALAKRLSEKCDIPLHLARGLVKASLGLQATESIMDHVKSSDVRKYSAEWKKVALENSGKITAEEYMQLHKPEAHGHRKN